MIPLKNCYVVYPKADGGEDGDNGHNYKNDYHDKAGYQKSNYDQDYHYPNRSWHNWNWHSGRWGNSNRYRGYNSKNWWKKSDRWSWYDDDTYYRSNKDPNPKEASAESSNEASTTTTASPTTTTTTTDGTAVATSGDIVATTTESTAPEALKAARPPLTEAPELPGGNLPWWERQRLRVRGREQLKPKIKLVPKEANTISSTPTDDADGPQSPPQTPEGDSSAKDNIESYLIPGSPEKRPTDESINVDDDFPLTEEEERVRKIILRKIAKKQQYEYQKRKASAKSTETKKRKSPSTDNDE
ncbi:hypothetical protein FOZ63_009614, partial [Perkinsus olseni]